MEIVVFIIAAGCVWYIYRHFAKTFKSQGSACGCSGCRNCPEADISSGKSTHYNCLKTNIPDANSNEISREFKDQ
jgi:hypothetical protein